MPMSQRFTNAGAVTSKSWLKTMLAIWLVAGLFYNLNMWRKAPENSQELVLGGAHE